MESCRLCLKKQIDMLSIFGQSEESVRIRRYILDCCPIQLINHEYLPSHICTECRLKLGAACTFRKQCRLSDRRLRLSYPRAFQDSIFLQSKVTNDSEKEEEEYSKDSSEVADRTDGALGKSSEVRARAEVAVEVDRDVQDSDSDEVRSPSTVVPDNTDKLKYLCDICSKTFASKSGLRFHLKSHDGVKPHTCRFCDKRFAIPSYKKRHERTHAGDKRFVCHVCSAAFASANGLKYHLSVHTGEANYRCDTCGKSFRRYKYLREHVFTHTGERPFACRVCGSAYSNSGSLFAHEKKCRERQARGDVALTGVRVATVERSIAKAKLLSSNLSTRLGM